MADAVRRHLGPGFQEIIRLAVAAAVLGLFVLVGMLTFTAITLLIGDPFYEKISEAVENRYGASPTRSTCPGTGPCG